MKTIHNQMMQISTLHWTNLVLDFFSPKFKSILVSPLYIMFFRVQSYSHNYIISQFQNHS